jgi:hypothetical protein
MPARTPPGQPPALVDRERRGLARREDRSMTLTELAEKARRHKALGAIATNAEAERRTLGEEIIAELDRRKIPESRTIGDVTITRSSRRTGYDVEALRERLSAGAFRAVTVPCVDTRALDRHIKDGKVSAEAVTAAERRSAAFPKVTIAEAA